MMPLEEAYPALSEKIRKARAQGYAEPEIQRYLQGKTQEAIRQGYSTDEVNKFLGRTGPSFMQRMAIGTPGDILAGALETLRDIGGVPEAPMQAIEAFPEERRKRQETLRPIFGAAAEPLGTAWEAARTGISAMTAPFIPRVVQESLAPPLAAVGKAAEAGAGTVLPPEVAKLTGEAAPDLLMLLGPAMLRRRPGAVMASPREFIKEAGEGFAEDARVQRLAELKERLMRQRSEALARRQAVQGIKVTPLREGLRPTAEATETPRLPTPELEGIKRLLPLSDQDLRAKVSQGGTEADIARSILRTRSADISEPVPRIAAKPVGPAEEFTQTLRGKSNQQLAEMMRQYKINTPQWRLIESEMTRREPVRAAPELMIEQTPAGPQTVIPGAETRRIPKGELRPRVEQTKALTPLGKILQGTIAEKQMELGQTVTAMVRRPKEQVVADLDALTAKARKRMIGADPSILGLRPAPSDWMTPEEIQSLTKLTSELPTFGEERIAAAERVREKRAARTSQRLEDFEVAVSTFIRRRGGMKIPTDLKEEFGGWNRLHNPKAMGADEMAGELHAAGLIPEPTTNALLEGLKARRKSTLVGEGVGNRQALAFATDEKMRELTETPAELEFKGKTYRAAIKEGQNIRLKDDPDKVLTKATDILSVDEKIPFDMPPLEKAIRTAEAKAAQEAMATQKGAIDISLRRTAISRWLDRDLSVRDIGRGTIREETGRLARETAIAEKRLREESNRLEKFSREASLRFIDAMEHGRAQDDPINQPMANELRQYLDSRRVAVQALGKGYLQNWIEDYFPHIWKETGIVQRILGRRPLRGPASFLKQRTIPTIAEGISRGLEPVTYNPIKLALIKGYEMDRFTMAHRIKDRFVRDGSAKFVRYGQKAPDGWAPLDDRTFKALQWSETEKGLVIRGQYYSPKDLARDFNNYLSPGLKGNPIADTLRWGTNNLNMIQLGASAWHAGFLTANSYLNDLARAAQLISQGQFSQAARPIGRVLTGTSPIYQYGRGSRLLQEYLEPGRYAKFSREAEGVSIAGGRGRQYTGLLAEQRYGTRAWDTFTDSIRRRDPKALYQSIPAVVDAMARPLMNQYVPRMKLGAFADLAEDIFRRTDSEGWQPEKTRAEIQRAWDSVDNRMGQLVYTNLFWNNLIKDAAHIAVRAVGWTYGTLREFAGGLAVDLPRETLRAATGRGFEVTPRMAYASIAVPIGQLIFSSIYQYLHTGELPQDLNDYLYPRNGRTTTDGNPDRTSLPVYLTSDIVPWLKSPLQTAENKLSPGYHALKWIALNRDFYGVQIYTPNAPLAQQMEEIAKYMGTQVIPFSVRNLQKAKETGAEKEASIEPFFGLRPAPRAATRSEEENRRIEERRRRRTGILTREEAERRAFRRGQ